MDSKVVVFSLALMYDEEDMVYWNGLILKDFFNEKKRTVVAYVPLYHRKQFESVMVVMNNSFETLCFDRVFREDIDVRVQEVKRFVHTICLN